MVTNYDELVKNSITEGRGTKLRIVLDEMYKITGELHAHVNYYGKCEDGRYLCYGKLYKNIDEFEKREVEQERGKGKLRGIEQPEGVIDFRHENVDLEVVQCAREYIINCVKEFCKKHQDGDLQTLFIGCILNLYYSSGLFDRNGCLDVKHIVEDMTDDVTSQYIGVMEKLMMKDVFSCFQSMCNMKLFTDEKADELLKFYIEEKEEGYLDEILSYINPNFEYVNGFVKEVINGWENFSSLEQIYGEGNSSLLLELCNINSEYQYANLLLCLESVKDFLISNGENDGYTLYRDKLDKDIFDLGMGKSKPSTTSSFGCGVPYLEYCDKKEERLYWHESILNETKEKVSASNIKNSVCSYYPKKVGVCICNIAFSMLKFAEAKNDAEKAIYEKKKVINQFSHTYMNMRATSLYNIATELLKNEDKVYRDYGRKLLYEYSVKKNLTKDVEMLKLRFEENEQELYKRIADSILSKEQSKGIHTEKLVDDAIIRCMVTLVHDAGIRAKKLRDKFEDCDWIEIRNNFENDILLADNRNVREWFRSNMFDLECSISNKWRGVLFEEDSYAALLFIDIISELLTNIFRYADKSKKVILEFRNEEDYMLVVAKNYVKACVEANMGGGYGLEAEAEVVKVINEINGVKEAPIKTNIEDGIFTVELRIAETLFEGKRGAENDGI